MGFWNRTDRELERRLRDERPKPVAELVHVLAIESALPKSRRSLVPKLAFVGVVAALLGASLGVAGAMGSASHSVTSLFKSVSHVVQPSHSGNEGNSGNGNNGNGNNGNGNNGRGDDGHGDGDDHGHDPFHHEYDHRLPICHDGHRLDVPSKEFFYRLLHGDHRFPCPPRQR